MYIYNAAKSKSKTNIDINVNRETPGGRRLPAATRPAPGPWPCSMCTFVYTPNPPTNIVGFRGLDSSVILSLRGGILMSIGDFPESLSQAMLVGCNVSREIGRTGWTLLVRKVRFRIL